MIVLIISFNVEHSRLHARSGAHYRAPEAENLDFLAQHLNKKKVLIQLVRFVKANNVNVHKEKICKRVW